MANNGFANEDELKVAMTELESVIKKLQAKLDGTYESDDEQAVVKEAPRSDLVGIPDAELTSEQIKEKRKQRLLKAGWDARLKQKEEKERARVLRERAEQQAEAIRLADPQAWLAAVRK